MKIELDGENISSEKDFHAALASAFGVQDFYGANLDALWDLLSSGVERPVTLVWKNSRYSEEAMGLTFKRILEILEKVKQQDELLGWEDKFLYKLG